MDLLTDIGVHQLIPEHRSNPLQINTGLLPIDPGIFIRDVANTRDVYRSGVFWPLDTWRDIDPQEAGRLFVDQEGALSSRVTLFELTDDVASLFSRLSLSRMWRSRGDFEEAKRTTFPIFVAEVSKALNRSLLDPFQLCSSEVSYTPPGIPTSTYDNNQGRYRGLHIDNWSMPPRKLEDRGRTSVRIGINVGAGPRSFVFVNLSVSRMLQMLEACGDYPHREVAYSNGNRNYNASAFSEAFMSRFPGYPVIRIDLEPNQGYIAPVNNALHDGYALYNPEDDFFLQLSAHDFRLKARPQSSTPPLAATTKPRRAPAESARAQCGPIDLLIVQGTSFCNLNCRYCYLPDRGSKAKLDLETFRASLKWVYAAELQRETFTVVWHAGEPLVLPIAFYEQATRIIAEEQTPRCEVRQAIQTNGVLLDDAWAKFFKTAGFNVGLSIDGPEAMHDSARLDRRGRGTFRAVMRATEALRRNDLAFHAIAVVTKATLEDPEGFVKFFEDLGVTRLGLNFEEIEGVNLTSSLTSETGGEPFRKFIETCVNATLRDGRLVIREVESETRKILAGGLVGSGQARPFRLVNVAHDGSLSTFSPELLGARWGDSDFVLGNVHSDTLDDVLRSAKFRRLFGEIEDGLHACQAGCRYFEICGGGAPSNKFFEHGRFDVSETLYCRLRKQAVHEAVATALSAGDINFAALSHLRI
jgi:uncharacterized protein